jgi:hypothetical protein
MNQPFPNKHNILKLLDAKCQTTRRKNIMLTFGACRAILCRILKNTAVGIAMIKNVRFSASQRADMPIT